jgi:putative N6-adenine-specific DNA methylase
MPGMGSYFVVTAPGLEQLAAQELRQLGLIPEVGPGGLTFKSDVVGMYRANLHLHTASRILARVGQFFYAVTFAELREKAGRLPWERFIRPGQPVSIRVTCHKSKLIHSDAVAERIAGAIYDRLGQDSPMKKALGEDGSGQAQLIVVRVADDQVLVSVDSSGELLHRRGYRKAVAKAPLRETLASAMLLSSGWDGRSPLVDPFCGSGTILIEAAMMSLGIPPGLRRHFAFMDWPGFDQDAWRSLVEDIHPLPVVELPIFGSDRDAGAVKMAGENAARAGVEACIHFACQAVSSISVPASPGWVVTNPPYGLRVSEGKDLRNLYAQFGNVLRAHCLGWNLAVLSNDPMLLGQIGITLDTSFVMLNGGVNVRLGRGRVE